MRTSGRRNKLLVLGLTAFLLIMLPVTILVSKRNTSLNSRASTNYKEEVAFRLIQMPQKNLSNLKSENNTIYIPEVKETANINIEVHEGEAFDIIDSNAGDGYASFKIQNADKEKRGFTTYSVYAQALNTKGSMKSCIKGTNGSEWCPLISILEVRDTPQVVTEDLLFAKVDLNNNGNIQNYNLFAPELKSYFWEADKDGNKVATLKFYKGVTTQ